MYVTGEEDCQRGLCVPVVDLLALMSTLEASLSGIMPLLRLHIQSVINERADDRQARLSGFENN